MSRVHNSFLGDQLRVADSWVNYETATTIRSDCKSCKVKNHYVGQDLKSDGAAP